MKPDSQLPASFMVHLIFSYRIHSPLPLCCISGQLLQCMILMSSAPPLQQSQIIVKIHRDLRPIDTEEYMASGDPEEMVFGPVGRSVVKLRGGLMVPAEYILVSSCDACVASRHRLWPFQPPIVSPREHLPIPIHGNRGTFIGGSDASIIHLVLILTLRLLEEKLVP